jgi:hypothetical protein
LLVLEDLLAFLDSRRNSAVTLPFLACSQILFLRLRPDDGAFGKRSLLEA